uniref:Uncharacterized protein n=1 Tax=Oryza punctata TaxID=4537 RepID=A0A0E0L6I3_ORYPU
MEHDDGIERRAVCGGSSSAARGKGRCGAGREWEQHGLWQIRGCRHGVAYASTGIVIRPPSPEAEHVSRLDMTPTRNAERRHTRIDLNLMSGGFSATGD